MVTIWRVALDTPLPARPPLADDECRRADRFRFPRDAHRFRVAHWAVRVLLAEITGEDASALRFQADAHGKPQLVGRPDVAFNLSHSHEIGLVAVLRSPAGAAPALGVDLEHHRPLPEIRGMAAAHFAPEEQDALWAVPDGDRLATFYRIWTRKEAFVKATGSGVGRALARFAVTGDARQARILHAADHPLAPTEWTMHDLSVAPSYAGALVVCAAGVHAELREWDPLAA